MYVFIKQVVVIFVLIAFVLFSSAFAGQEIVTVDFDEVIQDNFLGVNAVYHGFSYLPESADQGMNEKYRDIEMQLLQQCGLHIARTFYRPDWAMGQGAWSLPDWESMRMKALYRWLEKMQEQNIDVALNMGWWFGRDVIWKSDQHLPTYPDDLQRYAEWVSQSLNQIIVKRGFSNVKYICMFTEPGGDYGDIPHGKKVWEYYQKVVRATHQRLHEDGRRHFVKIIGPNTTNAPRWVAKATVELADEINILASHDYNFTTYQQWYDMALQVGQAAKGSGKTFWIDEYGVQDFELRKSPLYGNIIGLANVAFLNAGAQNSLLWILNDQYYPAPIKYLTNGDSFQDGLHKWGLFPWLPVSQKVRPAWYAFAMMSKLMGGPGSKVFRTKGKPGLHLAATRTESDATSILVVNEENADKNIAIHMSGKIDGLLYRYQYVPSDYFRHKNGLILSDKVFAEGKTVVQDTLSAKAVAIYSNILLPAPIVVEDDNTIETNIALHKKVTTSSSDPDFVPEYLVDGRRLFYWSSEKKKGSASETFTVDLASSHPVSKIALYPRGGTGEVSNGFPLELSIALSSDQLHWKEVVSDHFPSLTDATVKIFRFQPEDARYVRVTGGRLSIGRKGVRVMQIAEIKVFAGHK